MMNLGQRFARRVRYLKWKNYFLSFLIPNTKLHPNIIVLGNQKSGTTAIASLLATAVGKSVILDFPDMFPHLHRFYNRQNDFGQFIKNYRYCFSHDIVKEPNLTFLYSELQQIFPNAKYLFVIRDPRDNIRSILNRVKLRGDLLPQNSSIERSKLNNSVWQAILDGDWLPATSSQNYIENLAHRWRLATAVYDQAQQHIHLARYEDFLENKKGFIYQLAQNLGETPSHDIADLVDYQFQPAGNQHVSWLSFFGKHNLRKIEQICEPMMTKYQYPLALSNDPDCYSANRNDSTKDHEDARADG